MDEIDFMDMENMDSIDSEQENNNIEFEPCVVCNSPIQCKDECCQVKKYSNED